MTLIDEENVTTTEYKLAKEFNKYYTNIIEKSGWAEPLKLVNLQI